MIEPGRRSAALEAGTECRANTNDSRSRADLAVEGEFFQKSVDSGPISCPLWLAERNELMNSQPREEIRLHSDPVNCCQERHDRGVLGSDSLAQQIIGAYHVRRADGNQIAI